jgi:hypothetical protein
MLTTKGQVMTMGSIDHGKLGHKPKAVEKMSNFNR